MGTKDLVKQLISIPSTKENKNAQEEVLELVKNILSEYPIQEFEKNGVKSILVANSPHVKKFKLILNAHLDVIPGNTDQFTPIEKNGKLYGRGSFDMKAAGAVMILLFKEIAKDLRYPLGLQLVTDEEIGGYNGTGYQYTEGITADFVIAGENTDFAIRNEAKGVLWMKITCKGITGHGAYPWLGDNALTKCIDLSKKLQKLFPVSKKNTWVTTVNIAKIETPNETFNKIPNSATLWIDVRFTPKEKEHIIKKIKNLLPEDAEIEIIQETPAAYTDEKNPYVQKLSMIVKKVLGKNPSFIRSNGASDVRFYTSNGSKGVEFGVVGYGHHSDLEWVEIQSLEKYYQILKAFLFSIN